MCFTRNLIFFSKEKSLLFDFLLLKIFFFVILIEIFIYLSIFILLQIMADQAFFGELSEGSDIISDVTESDSEVSSSDSNDRRDGGEYEDVSGYDDVSDYLPIEDQPLSLRALQNVTRARLVPAAPVSATIAPVDPQSAAGQVPAVAGSSRDPQFQDADSPRKRPPSSQL